MKIEKYDFCIGNAELGAEELQAYLSQQYPDIPQRRWGCLGNCSNCFRRPFVLINDAKIVEADTVDELKRKIDQLIGAGS